MGTVSIGFERLACRIRQTAFCLNRIFLVTLLVIRTVILHRDSVNKHRLLGIVYFLNNTPRHFVIGDEKSLVFRILKTFLALEALKAHLLIYVLPVPEPSFIGVDCHTLVALIFEVAGK